MIYFRMFQHLLPRARAWQLILETQFREFITGLSSIAEDARLFFDAVWSDVLPSSTNQLPLWNSQFGLPETGLSVADQRDRVDAAWKNLGGQSPRYIEDTLQANGFNVFVHEFWGNGAAPAVPYVAPAPVDPVALGLVDADMLVNLIRTVDVQFLGAGDNSVDDAMMLAGQAEAQAGNVAGMSFSEVSYTVPTDIEDRAYILYISAPTFPNQVGVLASREQEFKELVLSLVPAQQWVGMFVNFV